MKVIIRILKWKNGQSFCRNLYCAIVIILKFETSDIYYKLIYISNKDKYLLSERVIFVETDVNTVGHKIHGRVVGICFDVTTSLAFICGYCWSIKKMLHRIIWMYSKRQKTYPENSINERI